MPEKRKEAGEISRREFLEKELIKEVEIPVPPEVVKLTVNGQLYELVVGKEVRDWHTLAYTIRDKLGFTGTKIACDHGACGNCTVLVDGEPILSCMTLTVECDGKSITTIEGLKDLETGALDPLQQAFVDNSAFQCGFCTPGTIMAVKALLMKNPNPTEQDVKESLAGHYCRGISHYQVIEAVMAAAGKGN